MIVEEQRQGPFDRWIHRQGFEELPPGMQLTDEIDFEPPRGILGLTVTVATVMKDLEWIFAFRAQKLHEKFGVG